MIFGLAGWHNRTAQHSTHVGMHTTAQAQAAPTLASFVAIYERVCGPSSVRERVMQRTRTIARSNDAH